MNKILNQSLTSVCVCMSTCVFVCAALTDASAFPKASPV